MLYVATGLKDRAEAQYDIIGTRLNAQGATLSNWMILGNATALFFTVGAMINGSSCAVSHLKTSALAFAAGLILTFLGMLTGFLLTLRLQSFLGDMTTRTQGVWIAQAHIDALEAKGIEVPDDAPLENSIREEGERMEKIHSKMKRWVPSIFVPILLILLGCGLFAYGLISPLASIESYGRCSVATAAVAKAT